MSDQAVEIQRLTARVAELEYAFQKKEAARVYCSTAKENAELLQRAYSALWDAEEELSLLKVPE